LDTVRFDFLTSPGVALFDALESSSIKLANSVTKAIRKNAMEIRLNVANSDLRKIE